MRLIGIAAIVSLWSLAITACGSDDAAAPPAVDVPDAGPDAANPNPNPNPGNDGGNDGPTGPTLSIDDVTSNEGNSGTTTATFTVTLSEAQDKPVTVSFATADGTATAGSDYVAANGTLTFAPGTTTQTVTVTVNGDATTEPDETFTVNLSGASNAALGKAQGTGTIVNDDVVGGDPALAINDVSVSEGNSGSKTATFTVTLTNPPASTVTVSYATANGTATAGSDYTGASGTLTFPNGTTTQTVDVTISGDTNAELDETFFVNLSNPSGATIIDGQGTGTITNDDGTPPPAPPSLSINDVSVSEGNLGPNEASFLVTLSAPSTEVVRVDYATANGTATAGSGDYFATNGTATFPPGTTTQRITVQVNGDTTKEPNETFLVNLSNPVHAAINDGQGVGTIIDDETAPSLSIGDATVIEGNGGKRNATFTVTLSAPTSQAVTVNYATANQTATAGTDYDSTSGTLTFPAGVTTRTITVPVDGDNSNESNETFTVDLTAPKNATIADGQGVGTIIDDESGLPTLTIANASTQEGNSGSKAMTFTVTLSQPSTQAVTVKYATANGTASSASDYTEANGTLTFAPNETEKTITVNVTGDTTHETNETLFVNLSNANNALLGDNRATGTIEDDDDLPKLSINDVTKAEGNIGFTQFAFTVTLSAASAVPVSVGFQTGGGTATALIDYSSTSGTVVFAPGQTTQTITVNVNGDGTKEGNDTFFVNLDNATGATITDDRGVGTITNDDN
jgi:hypothetical protein